MAKDGAFRIFLVAFGKGSPILFLRWDSICVFYIIKYLSLIIKLVDPEDPVAQQFLNHVIIEEISQLEEEKHEEEEKKAINKEENNEDVGDSDSSGTT